MRVLVIGATGFLGSNAISKLLSRHDEVAAFSRQGIRAGRLGEAGVDVIIGDLLDRESVLGMPFDDVDVLMHFGSTTNPGLSVSNPSANDADIDSSTIIFQRAVESGIEKILFSSSGGTIYGNPSKTPVDENQPIKPLIQYAHTKAVIETRLQETCSGSKTTPVILRFGNPYGPNQYPERGTGVITAWLEAARDGKAIHVFGHMDSARDFVFISDASAATILAADRSEAAGVYNIGTGRATTLRTLLETIEHVVGSKLKVVEHPPRPSDKVSRIALDSTRAHEHLGWSPVTTLEEGISITWDWVRSGEPFRLD